MQSVGTRLREARIKRGYTLEEINARTRISLKNLSAIESDDLSKISSPFTYRSFVKQISDLVGVDHAMLAADALTASSTMPAPLIPGQEEEVFVRPHQFKSMKAKANWNWFRMASIATAAGAISVYVIWRNGGIEAAKLPVRSVPASSRTISPSQNPQPQQPVAAPPKSTERRVIKAPTATPNAALPVRQHPGSTPASEALAPGTEQLLSPSQIAARVAEPATRTAVQAAPQPPASGAEPESAAIHIELSAIEPTRLSISADGKTTYIGTLAPMETKSFDGKDTAEIRTPNAGGVNIIFNGRALGPLGPRGQARTVVFTKNGYEVVHGVGVMEHLGPTGGE